MPPGPIIPELVYDDLGAAVAWLCEAFGLMFPRAADAAVSPPQRAAGRSIFI